MTRPRRWLIGRIPTCDIVVPVQEVSSQHCELRQTADGFTLADLGSSNGTYVNGTRLTSEPVLVTPQDTITLGKQTPFPWPPEALTPQVVFTGRRMIFGRRADCDHVLNGPMISGQHAQLTRTPDGLLLEDLESANGTFLNGWRLTAPVLVNPGDVIGLGTYTFTLLDTGHVEPRNHHVTLEAREVCFRVGSRPLIENISLTAYGGEFVGLMGPSGAGKTTLLNVLNGYTKPTEGQVLINGHDLYQHYDWFRHSIGYVPQEDVMHRDLTVGQALYHSARLRLPSDYTDAEIQERIGTVLEQLGLAGTENVLIGSAEKKGISGGQRKRVNLALELLTDPLILFLDEPTSGLSSQDALMVMDVLKELARQGKVIILTIHQPSLPLYKLLDQLMVVAKDRNTTDPGQLVYYGPAYPDALNFFAPDADEATPDVILEALDSDKPTKTWAKQYLRSTHQQTFINDRAGTDELDLPPPETPALANDFLTQWRVLTQRLLLRKFADHLGTAILLGQAPAFAILLWMVFGKALNKEVTDETWPGMASSVTRVVFQLTLAAIWFGCSNAIREVVGEWAVYKRERMVNLKLLPYVLSKFTLLGALSFVQCVVLLVVVHFGCGLQAYLFPTFLLMLLASFVGIALGLLISAASKSNEIAIALLPLVQLIMVVLGGGMQYLHEMPRVVQVLAQTMPSRWAFEGALLLEADQQPVQPPPSVKLPNHENDGGADMASFAFPDEHRTSAFGAFAALFAMFMLLSGAVLGVLRLRDVH